jgi:hypothetical protein
MSVPTNAIVSNGIGSLQDDQINTFVQTDQTVAQLRTFVGKTGMGVFLQGATVPGDGSAGLYCWFNGSYTDDGVNTIVPSAAAGIGAWKLATMVNTAPLASPTFTGVPAAPTAAAGTNTTQLATTAYVLASYAAPPAIGGTTPAAAAFTTLSASGLLTVSSTAGIKGTTLADSANAGSVGEYVTSTVLLGSAVALTTGVAINVTSISLTAGDWNVWGTVAFAPAGTTTVSAISGSISTTTGTMATVPGGGSSFALATTLTTGAAQSHPVGMTRISVAATTTVFLVAQSTFAVSTNAAYGIINARRIR